jgi:hypothetical protein
MFLADFHFQITYRAGRLQGKPDALSRQPALKPKEGDSEYEIQQQTLLKGHQFIFATSDAPPIIDAIKKAYPNDILAQELLSDIKEKTKPYIKLHQGIILINNKIYVPEENRIKILELRHDAKLAGHFGITRTINLIRRNYWWPSLNTYVKDYIKTCNTCCRAKTSKSAKSGELQPLPIPKGPWKDVSMDFVTDLPPSRGFDSILVIVDRFTKMGHFIPCNKTVTAEQTANLFIQNILRLHGAPSSIVSDRGVQFTSHFWKSFNNNLGTKLSFSSAFHPETDGQTERLNQTMEQYLRCYTNYTQDDWVDLLPLAEFSYNNSDHASTKQSPFLANYGYHPTMDFCLPNDQPPNDRTQTLKETINILTENIQKAQDAYTSQANKKRKPAPELKIGSKVWLRTTNIRTNRPSKKFDYRKLGPFKVIEKINPVCYRILLPDTMRIHNVFHTSLLEEVSQNDLSNRHQAPPLPIVVDGHEEYEVEAILSHRRHRGRIQYLVQWKGYGPEANTWEPRENLETASHDLLPLTTYHRSLTQAQLVTLA